MRLSLLLPARKHVENAITAVHWLARGDRMANAAPGRESALRDCFEVVGAAIPIAALTRSIDADDAADALWLRADPAFIRADAVTLRLLACGNMGLAEDEVRAVAQAVKPLLDEAGYGFDAPHPQRWYLRCPRDAMLPEFSSPDEALGDDLANHLPTGENARRWRGLLNDVQIVLTQHPLNARRVQRGLPPVNSLWFWGAGTLPESIRCRYAQVYSGDAVVAGLCKLAKVEKIGPLGDARAIFSASGNVVSNGGAASLLIDLQQYRDIARLESEWLAPIDAALKARKITRLELLFESGERYIVKPAHRWRFWRRVGTT